MTFDNQFNRGSFIQIPSSASTFYRHDWQPESNLQANALLQCNPDFFHNRHAIQLTSCRPRQRLAVGIEERQTC
jgi:hypothetical protein